MKETATSVSLISIIRGRDALRDQFAHAALSNSNVTEYYARTEWATVCYDVAEEMLKERERRLTGEDTKAAAVGR